LLNLRVSESRFGWVAFARGWASTLPDLERLISRQKAARATTRDVRSTSATSFQSNPLWSAPDMFSTLIRKGVRPGFSKLRLVNYE